MLGDPKPLEPGALVLSALAFYAVMAVLGIGGIAAQDSLELRTVIFGDGEALVLDTALGAVAGLVVVFLTRMASGMEAMQRLSREMAAIIGSPSTGAIAILAVVSSVGEEILFRGAIQPLAISLLGGPTAGVAATAVVFGLLHGGSAKRLRLSVFFATLAGVLLGVMALLTGNLLAPILCHVTVNYFNLHVIAEVAEEGP